MTTKNVWRTLITGACLVAAAVVAAPYVVVALISESHIDANVPSSQDFERYLVRDLQSYFQSRFRRNVVVRYELLRAAPTQGGVAYPKYYIWVKVFDGATLIEQGAGRLAAIDRSRFEVMQFLTQREIVTAPAAVGQVFPQGLVEDIVAKARVS